MATLTSPVTGSAQTGLTSPTFTLVVDSTPPRKGANQYIVSALGGTQLGVLPNSIYQPYTATIERPEVYKTPLVDQVTGAVLGSVPRNKHTVRVRKGVKVGSGDRIELALYECHLNVPAGSEAFDTASLRSAISLLIGSLQQYSAGLGDQVASGILGTA